MIRSIDSTSLEWPFRLSKIPSMPARGPRRTRSFWPPQTYGCGCILICPAVLCAALLCLHPQEVPACRRTQPAARPPAPATLLTFAPAAGARRRIPETMAVAGGLCDLSSDEPFHTVAKNIQRRDLRGGRQPSSHDSRTCMPHTRRRSRTPLRAIPTNSIPGWSLHSHFCEVCSHISFGPASFCLETKLRPATHSRFFS